ncbi:hypothetical protein IJZ97_05700 [bacterium]|nr:hypothetical protein [bacterium]
MNPATTSREYCAGLCEENNRGYSVAFSGSGASKKTSEAAAKVFKWALNPKGKKVDLTDLKISIEDVTKEGLKKSRLQDPKKYKYGAEYGEYPEYSKDLKDTFGGKALVAIGEKLADFFCDKTSVAQALMALFVAGGLRPATNIAMSTKEDRVDSMHAAAHAISSAVIGYTVSSLVLKPFDDAFKSIGNDVKTHLAGKEKLLKVPKIGPRVLETSPRWGVVSAFCKQSFDSFILGVPKAMLTIALIPPILKYVFGIEKGAKKAPAQAVEVSKFAETFKDKPVFAAFNKGGAQ